MLQELVDVEPAVSVVVATRDRGALVTRTIESVLACEDIDVELIVIDQSSTDATELAVEATSHDERLTYIRSATEGVSRARNIGLRLARNPIVLITDDDVVVSAGWARRFWEATSADDRVAVAFCAVDEGPYDADKGFMPAYPIDEEIVIKSLLFASPLRGMGAGMAVRRDEVLAFGGFDEMLGPGAPLRAAEDRDLAARALALGWWLLQTPDARVVHHGFRTWSEGRSLARRDWYGIGAAYAKLLKCRRFEVLPAIGQEVIYGAFAKPLVRFLIRKSRHSNLRQIIYFSDGFVRGLRTPVNRSDLAFVGPGEDASHTRPGLTVRKLHRRARWPQRASRWRDGR